MGRHVPTNYDAKLSPEEAKKLAKRAYQQLREFWPDIFNLKNPRPLAIGITDRLIADTHRRQLYTVSYTGTERPVGRKRITRAIAYFTGHENYLKALTTAELRYDVDGTTRPMLEAHRQHARDLLAKKERSVDMQTS